MLQRNPTSFDIKFLSGELNEKLKNARVQKVFSFIPGKRKENMEIHILLHIPSKGTHRLIISPGKIFLTKKPVVHDESSGNFALYLRKHLKSKRIIGIKQHNFDRVVIVEFEENYLVCELFGKGNIIFLDKEKNILAIRTRKIWSGRALTRGEKYIFPPESDSIFSVKKEEFAKMLKQSPKMIVAFLSAELSAGSQYANAICNMANIGKAEICSRLDEKQADSLFRQIKALTNAEKKPFVVEGENREILDFYPVKIPQAGKKQFKESFIDAVEAYCIQDCKMQEGGKAAEEEEKEVKKRDTILASQMKNKEKIEKKISKATNAINAIKQNYQVLEAILSDTNNALLKFKISEVRQKILTAKKTGKAGNINIIENIDEKTKEISFVIDGVKFKFSLNKTIEQNLALYYDELKKTKAKIERLAAVQKQQAKTVEKKHKKIKAKPVQVQKQWYHRFRWFFTSNNILAVGGKTAQQNEEVIKKYAKDKDLVFHCDIAGSPFVVMKTSQAKNEPTKEDLYETAVFSAVHSKAWRVGIGAIESYWVKREQVTKKAPSGEYIGTGSFMIYGKKNIIKTVLEYAIGFADRRVIFGPVDAVQKQTGKFIVIIPGDVPKTKLAKQAKEVLAEKLNKEEKEILRLVNVNDIENALPGLSGNLK